MTKLLAPLVLALSVGTVHAAGAPFFIEIAPGDTLFAGDGASGTYFGTVYNNGGAFSHDYFIDFSTSTRPDEWTFKVHATSLELNGTTLTGLNDIEMALYRGMDDLMWRVSADTAFSTTVTPAGTLVFGNSLAYQAAMYDPGHYRFEVTGMGAGFYDVTITVPEPETWAVFLAGLALLGLRLRGRFTQGA